MNRPPLYDVAAQSDAGTVRATNEDAAGHAFERESLLVVGVADGVSGQAGARTASTMAVSALLRAFAEEPSQLGAGKRLARAVQRANIEVHERSLFASELSGMATTLTAATLDGAVLSAAHVGDSRLYLLRDRELRQLTKDHTVAAEQVRLGLMSEERARTHAGRAVLTRSLGRELIVGLDRLTLPLAQEDVFLLCSDGLYGVLDDGELAAELLSAGDAAAMCRALIGEANRRGTPDNLTAAVVRVLGPVAAPSPRRNLGQRLLAFIDWRRAG
jgi:serine/threonine protein phosphatase PrpC